jgi:hypothetical protein
MYTTVQHDIIVFACVIVILCSLVFLLIYVVITCIFITSVTASCKLGLAWTDVDQSKLTPQLQC